MVIALLTIRYIVKRKMKIFLEIFCVENGKRVISWRLKHAFQNE